MIKIENAKLEYLDHIETIAKSSDEYLVPNNRMIYYLCCTIFSKYSYVALKNEAPIGYLFTMAASDRKLLWLHQIAIEPNERSKGIANQLIQQLENTLLLNKDIETLRCAIRTDNLPSKNFFVKHGYEFYEIDSFINMAIFEKKLHTSTVGS